MAAAPVREHDERIDWEAAERSPEFRELIDKQKRFIVPATVFFFVWYFGFIILAGYAPDFMGSSVYEGLTVGYVLALTQFVMVWVMGWLYLRKADRTFDPLREAAAARALEAGRAPTPPDDGRFARGDTTTKPEVTR